MRVTKWLVGVGLVALLLTGSIASAAELLRTHWDSSTSLDYAAGGILTPTLQGSAVAITTGDGGKWNEGVHLPAGGSDSTRVLQYSAVGNIDPAKGTVQFWYKPGVDSTTFFAGGASRLLTVQTGSDLRLIDIYHTGFGGFDSFVQANQGQSGRHGFTFDADDWLYFAQVWDAASGDHKMWVGVNSGMATNTFHTTGVSPWTPDTGPDSINIGSFDSTLANGQFTRGVFDDLRISDTMLYDPSASSIAMPTQAFPEPASAGLVTLGALFALARRRRRLQ